MYRTCIYIGGYGWIKTEVLQRVWIQLQCIAWNECGCCTHPGFEQPTWGRCRRCPSTPAFSCSGLSVARDSMPPITASTSLLSCVRGNRFHHPPVSDSIGWIWQRLSRDLEELGAHQNWFHRTLPSFDSNKLEICGARRPLLSGTHRTEIRFAHWEVAKSSRRLTLICVKAWATELRA